MFPMGIAENLVRLRKAAKPPLSQPELAKKAGVSQQLISQIENNKNTSTKYLPQIARALSVSVYEIDENFTPDDVPVGISAPLISWVSAGRLLKPDSVSTIEDAPRVAAPDLDPRGEWIALRVEGDSMDRISPQIRSFS